MSFTTLRIVERHVVHVNVVSSNLIDNSRFIHVIMGHRPDFYEWALDSATPFSQFLFLPRGPLLMQEIVISSSEGVAFPLNVVAGETPNATKLEVTDTAN